MCKKNIFVFPAGFSGCAWWRIRNPLNKLIKLGSDKINLTIHDSSDMVLDQSTINKYIKSTDVFVLQAPGCTMAAALIDLYHQQGKKVIIEYDDFSFDLSPSNPRYTDLGLEEKDILDENGKVIKKYRNNENKFDVVKNKEKHESFIYCLKNAEAVTTTTPYLAEKFKPHAKKVEILPNSIDFDLWKPIKRMADEKEIRIGWFGGDSHHKDLIVFKELFKYLQDKYSNVKFVIMAPKVPFWGSIFELLDEKRVEWHDWTNLHMYTLVLASMDWDIGLCPLEENDFNKCKSNIKWLEFSALKVPVVAQNMLPYNDGAENGKNILLAGDLEEWKTQVSKLIESQELRNTISENAYDFVYKNYNLDKNCRAWERCYLEVSESGPIGCASIGSR